LFFIWQLVPIVGALLVAIGMSLRTNPKRTWMAAIASAFIVLSTAWYTLDGANQRQGALPSDSAILVAENAYKQAIVPIGAIGDDWKSALGFNDSGWTRCNGSPGGVGYDRGPLYDQFVSLDLEDQMYTKNATCYIRVPFAFSGDPDEFDFLTLRVRYDDGFIAYLNGIEVARRNFDGTPTWNSNAGAGRSDDAAVEFESFDLSAFLGSLQRGGNLLAVQGLNTSTTSSDFLISFELIAGQDNSAGPEGTSTSSAYD
jgi:hypothetical protein